MKGFVIILASEVQSLLDPRRLRLLGLGDTPANTSWARLDASFVGGGGDHTGWTAYPPDPAAGIEAGFILCTSRVPLREVGSAVTKLCHIIRCNECREV